MASFIVYTPEGFTSGPNSEVIVDNCQVLGFVEARSSHEAIGNLFEQNNWIREAGFTIEKAVALSLANL